MEALGKHFTGLAYHEADFLSRTNKEFVRTLFPETPIYATLFNAQVQATIEQLANQVNQLIVCLQRLASNIKSRRSL